MFLTKTGTKDLMYTLYLNGGTVVFFTAEVSNNPVPLQKENKAAIKTACLDY